MKKKIFIFLLIFSFGNFSANENLNDSIKHYYKASANLNIRKGAGKKFPIIFTLKKGDKVQLLSKNNNWSEIKHLEKTGFVYSKYLIQSRKSPSNAYKELKRFFSYVINIIVFIFLLIIAFKIFKKVRLKISKRKDKKLIETVTDLNRGTWSERDLVLKLLKFGFSEQDIFHDLVLNINNDKFSQIDLVVVTEVGIFVIEVKDYKGWIYGNGNYSNWTQSLAFGKQKYNFYNPILQNNKHREHLKTKLKNFQDIPFFSIIVFYGDCELKNISFVPDGTFVTKAERVFEVISLILNNYNKIEYFDKLKIVNILKEFQSNGNDLKMQEQHIDNIKDMLGKHRVFE